MDGPLPLWPPLLVTKGPGSTSDGHAHHAIHLVLALEGELRVRGGEGSTWRSAPGVLTAPDVEHAIDARGVAMLLAFFDPESDAGAVMLGALAGHPLRLVDAAERGRIRADGLDAVATMREGGVSWSRHLAGVLGTPEPPLRRVHPRIRKLLRHLQALPAGSDTSLPALAAAVGLSPGRLMHAFTESIGVPLRPYLLWCKLQRAAAGVVAGLPLAEVATETGFSDAAHMARVFRRMFGVPPSALRLPRSEQAARAPAERP
jgi:AraC-like DNA-binding protein